MTADERTEKARAAKEARDGAAARSNDRSSGRVEDAMQRYLASESFHEHRREEQERRDAALADDEEEQ
jgi:hypothetical protein